MREQIMKDTDGRNRLHVEVTCQVCNKQWWKPKRVVLKQPVQLCVGGDCRKIWNNAKENRKCDFCGKDFEAYKKKRSKSGLSFCSRKCKDEAQSVDSSILSISHYRGGKNTYRERAIKKYGAVCNICGYHLYPEVLEVHHKDGNRGNNHINNLEVLCANCHTLKTKGC